MAGADLTERVIEQLEAGQPVRQRLPGGGRIHIERPLPFLLVHGRPPHRRDPGTAAFVTPSATFLHAPSLDDTRARFARPVESLLASVTDVLLRRFERCLLFEIRTEPSLRRRSGPTDRRRPHLRLSGRPKELTPVLEALKTSLEAMPAAVPPFSVELARPEAAGAPLLPHADERVMQACLEMEPLHFEPGTELDFPLVRRRLRRHLHHALLVALHEYTARFATVSPPSPEALARSRLLKVDRAIDAELTELCCQSDFLLDVTPINSYAAWLEFSQSSFERPPRFLYRELVFDPSLAKRRLFDLELEAVEDPELGELFRDQREELAHKLTMLEQRNTRKFLYGSLQLYGGVEDKLYELARDIAGSISEQPDAPQVRRIGAEAFRRRAEEEIEWYQNRDVRLSAAVELRDDVAGLLVSGRKLLVDRQLQVAEDRVEALIQHEVGTHLLTHHNGSLQPLQQFATGLAFYEETQEALAVLSEYLVGGLQASRLRLLAARVIAVHSLTNGADFVECFRELTLKYRFSRSNAFNVTMRVYRSGGLTKDVVYLRGLVGMLRYLRCGGSITSLYVGKISTDHVDFIEKFAQRGLIHGPALLPSFVADERAQQRLSLIRAGLSPRELVESQKQ